MIQWIKIPWDIEVFSRGNWMLLLCQDLEGLLDQMLTCMWDFHSLAYWEWIVIPGEHPGIWSILLPYSYLYLEKRVNFTQAMSQVQNLLDAGLLSRLPVGRRWWKHQGIIWAGVFCTWPLPGSLTFFRSLHWTEFQTWEGSKHTVSL